ncbi:hypothetical protein ACMS1Z_13690 [Acidiphilium multivorum]|uniref:hypothetical protein n=1 Tax=Acidiphilium multivorum TaxID=62140 RepID=UPI0039C8DBB5
MNRRSTIKAAMAGAIAAVATPAVVNAATNPDAQFIADCNEFIAVTRTEWASFKAIPDDDERDVAMASNLSRQETLIKRIWAVDKIHTPEGARAAARAILASSTRAVDGNFAPDTLEQAVAVTLADYMTGGIDPMAGVA